jgi:hypothetical protein
LFVITAQENRGREREKILLAKHASFIGAFVCTTAAPVIGWEHGFDLAPRAAPARIYTCLLLQPPTLSDSTKKSIIGLVVTSLWSAGMLVIVERKLYLMI